METLHPRSEGALSHRPIQVGIVDDHPITRQALRCYLEEQEGMRVLGEASSGREAIALVRAHALDVLLLDIDMRGQSGFDALPMIRANAKDGRLGILVLSGYPEESYALPFLRRGARGYLSKSCPPAEIAGAIRRVAQGGRYITPKVAELLANQVAGGPPAALHEKLSARELQLLLKMAKGRSPQQIADEVCLSPKTIGTYRNRLLRKFHARTPAELTGYVLRHRLLD